MWSVGIMQGRLTPSRGRGIQFFPFDEWQNEFYAAKEIGLTEIEWIFDYDRYQENPIWTEEGRNEVVKIMDDTGVRIRSVCFDYFMRRSFYKQYGEKKKLLYKENVQVIQTVLKGMAQIGAELLEIPVVDDSSAKTEEERELLAQFLRGVDKMAMEYAILISIETDFPPHLFKEYLDRFGGRIYANYDSGNSSALGYHALEEIVSLGNRIMNVHIKDRIYHGTTMPLGNGDADFNAVFCALKDIGYSHSFILQAARGRDGKEKENITDQLAFLREHIGKSLEPGDCR